MKKILFILLFLVLNSSLYAASQRTIRFATEPTYPPFEYVDSKGEIQGFDIDIAKAVCKELNATCTFQSQSFNSLILSLNMGKYDALIAALNATPERLKQVSFTIPYYQPSASFVAAKNKHHSALKDVIIGVQAGSVFEKFLQENSKQVTTKTYVSIQDAFLDLTAGRIDVVIADSPIAKSWLKNNNEKFELETTPVIDSKYLGEGYAIAVNKKNNQLLSEFNTALDKIKKNGTYDQLVEKYFGK